MHTAVIIVCGFVLLGLLVTFGWLWHVGQFPSTFMIKLFMPIWLAISLVNVGVGVLKAGYPLDDELAILPQVLIPPILAAIIMTLAF